MLIAVLVLVIRLRLDAKVSLGRRFSVLKSIATGRPSLEMRKLDDSSNNERFCHPYFVQSKLAGESMDGGGRRVSSGPIPSANKSLDFASII